jgi:arylsulfatase A-like enzyme/Tfp pilus assembly protein PilF
MNFGSQSVRLIRVAKLIFRIVLGVLIVFSFGAGYSAKPRNLILITIDTLRADYLSCNGSVKVKTPNLDGLASRGVNFTRTRTPVPLTLPSHTSIMTSLYPAWHGVRDNGAYHLSEKFTTLAEVLKKQGYTTAAFVGSFVLDHRFGLAQGFDSYDDKTSGGVVMLERPDAERNAEAVYDAFSTWFKSHSEQEPFFVWIHFYDPHAPYNPPKPYLDKYPRDPYAGEVAYTDTFVGRVVKDLEQHNLFPSSMMAVVGDHGEGLGDHQERNHSVLIYNSTLHVPMIVVAPGLIPPASTSNELCRTIDLAPTLLDYVGLPQKFGDGESLRASIEKKKENDIEVYSESLYARLNLGWSDLSGLENSDYKFIQAPHPELYDLRKDPGETKNQIQDMAAVARDMQSKLGLFHKQSNAASQAASASVDPETREKLASLGYISGSTNPAIAKGAKLPDPKEKMPIWNQIQAGLYQYEQGDYRSSVQTFQKILATEKDNPLVYDYLGSGFLRLKQSEEAEKYYRLAIQRGIDSAVFHLNLGIIHFNRNELPQAQQEFERTIAMEPSNVTAHFHLGNVFRMRGELERAVEEYQRALEINPSYVYAKNGLGRTYAAMKRDQEALQAFEDVVHMDPTGAPGYFNLAVELERFGRTVEALKNYRKFMKLSNDNENGRERQRAAEAIKRLETKS